MGITNCGGYIGSGFKLDCKDTKEPFAARNITGSGSKQPGFVFVHAG
jgi:hypothetical protein